jgi:hypothetical protein
MEITIEEWVAQYKPIVNTIDPEASWDGTMYETYGQELLAVQNADPNCVWTYLDTDNGTAISAGMGYVNRIGYFITEVPHEPLLEDYSNHTYITVSLDFGNCDNCGEEYEVWSREGRCGDCGDCGECCTHDLEA